VLKGGYTIALAGFNVKVWMLTFCRVDVSLTCLLDASKILDLNVQDL
jgi:hypothetical protein